MAKIIRQEVRQTKEIKLPKTGLTVVIYSSLLAADLSGVQNENNDFENGLNLVAKIIKSWNYYASEAEENPLPITKENIKTLPLEDFTVLQSEFSSFFTEQKKSSVS